MNKLMLVVGDDDKLKLFWGEEPEWETYQKYFKDGYSAYFREDIKKGFEIPSNLYKLDILEGGVVFVQLLWKDRCPQFATSCNQNQNLSIGSELPIDEWIQWFCSK